MTLSPLQIVMFLFASPLLIACIAMVWYAIRDAFDHPNVHLLRAEWRNPALLSDDDPRRFQ